MQEKEILWPKMSPASFRGPGAVFVGQSVPREPLTWTLSGRVRKRLLENMISNLKPEDEQKLSGELCVGED